MKSLFPYYEKELASLTTEANAFAYQYPRVAESLRISSHGSDDPHVARLMQSAAWFSARVTQQLDDGYAGFAETLLDAIFPHYRRPFPACAVARFTKKPETDVGDLRRGTTMFAGLPGGSPLRFTTVFDVDRHAPDLTQVTFHPAGRFDARDGAMYHGAYLELRWVGRQGGGFRVFVDGGPSVAAALRDALGLGIKAVLLPDPLSDRHVIASGEVLPVGFDEDHAVLEDPVGINPCFSLLREWLARPDTFGFFDLRWPDDHGERTDMENLDAGTGRVILMLDARIVRDRRDLHSVSAANLTTRCGLVANLFRASTGAASHVHNDSRIQIRPEDTGYAPDGLVAIESVKALQPGTGVAADIPHFHGVGRLAGSRSGSFWVFGSGIERETGRESLLLVDHAHQPVPRAVGAALSIRLLCCDGNKPREIVCGTAMAELHASENVGVAEGQLISRPTAVSRFPLGKQASWRLVSHLAVSQLSLLKTDGSALRRLIELYLPADSAYGEQIVRAIVGIRHAPMARWLDGATGVLARGTGIDVRIDRNQLVGIGLHALAHVLDRFFSQYTHINSFTELTFSCAFSGEEMYRCRMRTGNGPLI